MKITTYFNILLILFLCELNISAQNDDSNILKTKFEKLIVEQYKSTDPGCVILVALKGKVIYQKAFGMANLELNVPMDTNMILGIGSITKQFTAVAILQLVEQGKLSLDDDITKFIKDYPTHGHSISVRHLLSHTSGIKSFGDIDGWNANKERIDFSVDELINEFKNQPMEFAPGTKWSYCNSGYTLAGKIIEIVSGMSYPNYLKEKLFKPTEMSNTYYGNNQKVIKNRAYPYQAVNGEMINAEYVSISQRFSSGSIITTAGDLLKWNEALKRNILINPKSLEIARTEFKLNDGTGTGYGLGWNISDVNGSIAYEHAGSINGYRSNAIYLPNEDVFVVILTNRDYDSPSDLSVKIAALIIGKPYQWKPTYKPTNLLEYKGEYLNSQNENRNIIIESEQLIYKRNNGDKIKLIPVAKDKFQFDQSFITFKFLRDKKGNIYRVEIKNRIPPVEYWKK
ncbi:MAG: beta-lactamase family protein [Bacteroidetes bacterium]|nr:beta-lactamase family protein [Bacteroidota bacterium]